LMYPNARYFIWQREWDFWMSESAMEKAPGPHVSLARERLASIKDRLSFIEPEAEIVPGVRAIAAPGHTPGHMALSFVSGDSQLIHVSDTVLYPLHLEHPNWLPVYDILPDEAKVSKQKVFDKAANEKALVFAHHFPPFPNIGRVSKQNKGWKWQPVQMDN
jgi:glyoxylase-like metal-dependent hydrolase (beta-lactamase superfamily II)